MARLTRYTQKIFGSTAGVNQIAQIGSLNAGAPVYSTNPSTIQGLANYLEGLFNIVIGGNSPAIEDFNAIFYLFAYQLAYLFEDGIPEWDSGTTYYTGSLAQESGQIFRSLIDTNLNNDPATSSNWAAPISPGLFSPTTMSVNTTVPSGYTLSWPVLNVPSGKTLTISSGGYMVGNLLIDNGGTITDNGGKIIY